METQLDYCKICSQFEEEDLQSYKEDKLVKCNEGNYECKLMSTLFGLHPFCKGEGTDEF